MSEFITWANLPDKKVKTVLIGCHERIIKSLNSLKIETVVLDDNPEIDFSVRNHADMAALHLGCDRIILDKRQISAAESLERMGFCVGFTEKNIGGEYPDDVRLNCAVVGNKMICGKRGVEPELLTMPFERLTVNQGYCKCSVCILTENAIITDDESIYKRTRDIFDALLISKGDILLEGKDYGFIGGASARLSGDSVTFFGSLKYHRDGDKIKDFAEKHGLSCVELFDGRLTDIGSVIPILQE